MSKLKIKKIKGKKYLYIRDRIRVNDKTVSFTMYVGRLEKISSEKFFIKLKEYQAIRLRIFKEYWMKRKRTYLDDRKAERIETLHYIYRYYREHYPDEFRKYDRSIFTRYVHGTTAIEGNTITLREAEELLEHNVAPGGKSIREIYEIINFRKLRDFLDECDRDVSEWLIKKIHSIIMENLLDSPGTYRRVQVLIEGSDHEPPPAFEVPELMRDLVKWYRKHRKTLHPFELAVLLHTKFVTVHPFVDGNGRVARALMNFVLEKNGYPPLYIGLRERESYLDAVSEGNRGNYRPIVDFLADVYIDQHSAIIQEMQNRIEGNEILILKENKELIEEWKRLKGLRYQ